MKIGIVTFHRALNYGAVLQACAMKEIFSQHSDTEMVDYWPDYHSAHYSLFDWRFIEKNISFKMRIKLLKSAIKRVLLLPVRLKRNKRFVEFINGNIVDTSKKPIKSNQYLPDDIDVFVYGSDQIWRVYDYDNYPKPDMTYLGEGVSRDKKLIAYSASMGDVNHDTLSNSDVIASLRKFNHISVREQALSDELNNINKLSSSVVLDPTFLVSHKYWENLVRTIEPNNPQSKYILYYSLIPSEKSSAIARKIAFQKGMELVEINGFETISGLFNGKVKQSAGPKEFLELIYNSEFVVSTSFHGVVFSIIFNKQFYACGMKGHSERVSSLLSKLNINNRLINDINDVNINHIIDYDKVMDALDIEIQNSKSLLESALSA
jgi:hypothetical protein